MVDLGFEELVQRFAQARRASDKAVEAADEANWASVRELWVRQVHELFDRMEGWLRPVIASGAVNAVREQRLLTEEYLGEYSIEALELQVGSLKMTFEPFGTLMLNAFGQINVMGPQGSVVLLLQGCDEESPTMSGQEQAQWFILHPDAINHAAVRSRSLVRFMYGRGVIRRALIEDSFRELFMDLFGIFY